MGKSIKNKDLTQAFLDMFRTLKSKMNYNNPLLRLPLAQMHGLHYIDERGRITMKELSEHLSITPPSATALVNNLVEQKFLQREADSKDRRTIHLQMTAKGSKALQKSLTEHCQRLEKVLSKLTEDEQTQFIKLLSKMTI